MRACHSLTAHVMPCADKPWELCGMDLFVEKPINRSKLEAILDQLQGQLSMQSTECSASETEILEPPEPCSTQQDPASALCSEPALVTDFTVKICWSSHHHLTQMCPSSGCRDMPIFVGCRGRNSPIMAEDLLRIAEGRLGTLHAGVSRDSHCVLGRCKA